MIEGIGVGEVEEEEEEERGTQEEEEAKWGNREQGGGRAEEIQRSNEYFGISGREMIGTLG